MWSIIGDPIALHNGVISALSFTGAGTNDLTVTGRPAFAASRSYRVVIDSTGETFKWSNDGGSTFEETSIAIQARIPYVLRNAEGELEGISLTFASRSGHTNTNRWDFTTTGTVVVDTEASLGYGTVINNGSGDGVILHGQYAKGNEDGLQLKLCPKMAGSSSSFRNVLSLPLNLGSGGLRHQQEYFEMIATANYTYRVDLSGIGAFDVRQVRSGSTSATGLFTCYATIYKTTR